ncbi:MAG: choice-of-anchor J domain-containing protein, partial [Candidatus Cloacimonadaceae bacterium]|nr:choice-of-anchor J domain-containing protein [Candidatus Cloacimonadaceae bacterium]
MKNALIVVILALLCSLSFAALSEYSFQQTTSAYTEITNPTQIHGPSVDDAMSPVINIGFDFMYDEVVYSTFKANTNGFITLNPASSASLSNALATNTLIMAGLWDDLMTDTTGNVSYELSGASPNQVLTVQFKNIRWYYSFTPYNLINYQIKLFQGTNKIEIIYGTMGAAPGTSASASIGLSGATAGNFLSITPATPTATYSSTVEFSMINGTHVPFLVGNKYVFMPPVPALNDLAAIAVNGNTTPSVNTATTYTVTVYNRGSNPQSTYSVQLINAANTVLATTPGTAIAAGQTIQVQIPWTPTVEGPVALRGKVVLTGDENTTNDITPVLNVTVMPAGIVVVTVGAGDQTARMPIDMFYRNSLNQTLYFPTEIGMFGNITAITLYNQFLTNLPNMPTKIWLGTTTQTDLSAGWIPSTQMTLVYDGTVNYPSGENNILIPLQTIFPYTGGNLVVLFNRPMDTGYYSSSDLFKAQTVGTNRARNIFSDSTVYDPANPGTVGTVTGQFAKTSFHMTPMGTDPLFAVNPASKDYGTVLMDTTHNQTFTVMNVGGGTLTINSITIAGSPFYSLQNMPTLPANLTTGQSITFVGRYNPTAAGTHTGTITITDNLRLPRTVALTGNCIDTTVNTMPYVQLFDGVTAPALPIDWSALISPGGTSPAVVTIASAPYSQPNCVRIYNGSPSAPNTMLIAPPLSQTIPTNTTRLKLWVKGTGAAYSLSVGVMTDPTNPATYQEVQNFLTPTAWTEFIIPFNGYTGTGRYIAIKHGNLGTGQTIYVDNATIELIAANDLATTALTGNITPSVNAATTYTASIFNWGTNPQSTYTVKLFSSTGTELATAPGTTVNPGQTVQIPLIWTPTTEGPVTIYARVILAGDQNPTNDNSPNLIISVMPAGLIVVTVGDGSVNARVPIDMYYRNSLNQTLYFPTELGMYGNITALQLYNQFTSTTLMNMPIKIWMGTTTQTDLTAGWIPSTQMTLVFDGNVNFPGGANDIMIPLQTLFPYTAGNLVVLFNRPMDTQYYSSLDYFKCQTVGTNRARNVYSDSITYDPAAPGAVGTVSGQFAKTTFFMTPMGPDPIFAITPANRDFGTVLINTTHNQTFTVMNVGGGTLSVSSITIAGSPFFSLQNLPTLPASLTTGQSVTFTGRYNPTAAGNHTATITVTDNRGTRYEYSLGNRENRDRMPHTVALSGNCIDTTVNALPYSQLFDAVTAPALPVDWTSLLSPAGSAAAVVTIASAPYSAPNCVRIYNGTTTATNVLLIAPPLAQTIPVNTTRMKIWVKGVAATYTLQVGVMTDPMDAATFSLIQTITTPTAWTEFIVPLNGYAGTGRFVAIKHGNVGTGQTIYVDNYSIELIAANDLGVSALTGNITPTAGATATYTASVFNWGTNPQSTYTVKLYNSANPGTELATATGTAVNPGQTVQIPIQWTPAAAGAMTIYAKVFLTGDMNPANDQGPNLSIVVNPAGMFSFTVGDGNQTARVPVDMYFKNSLFQTLFFPAETGNFTGQILGLQFYNNFTTNLPGKPTKVWIGTTTQTDLSAGWIPSTQLTLVFDGTINYPSGQNIITIPFTQPFMYLNGENLVLMVNRPMDTAYFSSLDTFQAQTVGTNRSRNVWSDSVTYDPANPGAVGTASGIFPKTTFQVIPGGVGHINGTVLGVGNAPLPGVAVSITQTGSNTTTNAAGQYQFQNILPGNYTISFSKYGYVTQSQNFVLEEDETEVINVTMQPMATVTVSGTILASDTGAGLPGASIYLTGYADYTANSTATGAFTVPNVYANQTYNYTILCPGYTSATGTAVVGATNHNMGNITLNEVAYAPHTIMAAVNDINTVVNVSWQQPDPNSIEVTESFEDATFPPADWTQTITNNGPPNTSGVRPTWSRFGAITVSGVPANPTDGSHQAGLWWSYDHQDEWLITPAFNCPPSAYLRFDSYVFLGSTNGDHYYVKVSADNGNTWTMLWDASTQTGGWNYYASPISIGLDAYGGQQIKIAF